MGVLLTPAFNIEHKTVMLYCLHYLQTTYNFPVKVTPVSVEKMIVSSEKSQIPELQGVEVVSEGCVEVKFNVLGYKDLIRRMKWLSVGHFGLQV